MKAPTNYRRVRELLELASAQVDSAQNLARMGGNAAVREAQAAATLQLAVAEIDPKARAARG